MEETYFIFKLSTNRKLQKNFTRRSLRFLSRFVLKNYFHQSLSRSRPVNADCFLGKSTKEKPSIIVSGADDGRVYLLRPQSWSQYIWHYSTDVILHREGSSIGVPAVGDVDGDGNVEVFVPEKNFIHVLTYAG